MQELIIIENNIKDKIHNIRNQQVILDRLIHHSHLISVTGESYRLKQKREAGLLDISNK